MAILYTIIVILLVIIVYQLTEIIDRMPRRDYVKEAMDRDNREKQHRDRREDSYEEGSKYE